MQLNKLKARAETAQAIVQRPQLVLPKDDIPTSDITIAGNTQRELPRESRWRAVANWLAVNPKVAFGLGIVFARVRCGLPGDGRLGRHWPGCWLLWRPDR